LAVFALVTPDRRLWTSLIRAFWEIGRRQILIPPVCPKPEVVF